MIARFANVNLVATPSFEACSKSHEANANLVANTNLVAKANLKLQL